MANWIEHAVEPDSLILAWQAPDQFGDRHRWAVGELSKSNEGCVFRYFEDGPEFDRLNAGRTYQELLDLGYQGYPAFDPKRVVHTSNALGPFLRRIPPRSRSDFVEYQKNFRLRRETKLSDFALLGLTEAKLPSDGFSLVNRLNPNVSQCELFLEVAGYRYYAKEAPLPDALGEPVKFVPEPTNERDPHAVMIVVRGIRIGYINRLQANAFLTWISECRVSGVVERLNGSSEKPRAFVFVSVAPKVDKQAA